MSIKGPSNSPRAAVRRNYATTGFVLAVSLLIVISAGTYRVTRQFIAAHDWVARTLQVNQAVTEVFSSVQDIQSGVRAYVVTGDEKFLASREAAATDARARLARLKNLLADNPRQRERLERLERLVEQRMAITSEIVNRRREEGFEAARAMVETVGQQHMSELRAVIAELRAEEDSLLQHRRAEVNRNARLTILGLCIGTAASVTVLLGVFRLLRRENVEREKTEQKFRALLESAPDAMVIVNRRGEITLVNSQAERLFGYARAEMLGQPIEMLVPARFRDAHVGHRAAFFAHPKTRPMGAGLDLFALRRDGTEFPVEISLSPLETTEGLLVSGSIRDITERLRAERAVRENEKRMRSIIETAHEAFISIDAEGCVRDWNGRAESVFGWTRSEALGRPLVELIIPQQYREAHRTGLRRYLATGEGPVLNKQVELTALRRDGSEFPVEITIWPLQMEGQTTFHAFVRDISERKAVERQLRQYGEQLEAANKELEAFAYSVSHDLRAPLRAVDGFSQAVLEDYGPQLPPEGRHYLESVRNGAQRMGQLIDDLLTFSRLSRQPLEKRTVNSAALVREVLEDLRALQLNRRVDIRIAELPSCKADPALLKQVWVNLLSNALKYTRTRDLAVIEVAGRTDGSETMFWVRDNGAGFDMQYAHKLFGVFQRLHRADEYEGTGVGLAIVQRVVHRHGGRVWAEGAADRGATFYFTLPQGDQP